MKRNLIETLFAIWNFGSFPQASLIVSNKNSEDLKQEIKEVFSKIIKKFTQIPIENLSEVMILDLEKDSSGKLANNISIDQIRKLKDSLSVKAAIVPYKFVAIFSADKMNMNASNSLLKALEDTASDTYILLIASDKNKLISTVRSRVIEIYSEISHKEDKSYYSNLYKILNPEVRFSDKVPILDEFVKFFSSEDSFFVNSLIDSLLGLMKDREEFEVEYIELKNYLDKKSISDFALNEFVRNSVNLLKSVKQHNLDPKQILLLIILNFTQLE